MKYYLPAALLLMASSCQFLSSNDAQTSSVNTETTKQELRERGAYLVAITGCGDCHTPKKMTPQGPAPDMDRFLSGYDSRRELGSFDTVMARSGKWIQFNGELTAAAGPWGVSFAANLTPDATGLGNWTLDNFKKAMRDGKYKGIDASRPLLPPMPWQNFRNMSDKDLEAIFEYLKSIRPVNNLIPAAIPPAV